MLPLLSILFLQIFSISAYRSLLGNAFEPEFFEINIDRDNPEKLYKEFEDFIVKFKRNYTDRREKRFRFQQFTINHNIVNKLNKESKQFGYTANFGMTKFGDFTKKEIYNLYSKYGPEKRTSNDTMKTKTRVKRQLDNLPVMFDLREKKIGGHYIISPIKNQGTCSCCWAFAATALAEAALSVHEKKMISLSDQEVCDCAARHGPGCNGGKPEDGLDYIKDWGLTSSEEYPYSQNRSTIPGRCVADHHDREMNPYNLVHYQIDPFNAEYEMTRHLYNLNVPIAVIFRVGKDFEKYEDGVLEKPDCDEEEHPHWHSGVIIGYGTTRNDKGKKVDYWIFKNSWDTDYGEDGYVRIVRGKDWCGIESSGLGARIPE